MFEKILLTLAMLLISQSVISLDLVKGGKFEVCQEVFEYYIKGNEKYLEPRYLINRNEGKFTVLKRNSDVK